MKSEFFLLRLVYFNPSGRSAKISCSGRREPLMTEPSGRGTFNPLGGTSCVHSTTRMNMLFFFTVHSITFVLYKCRSRFRCYLKYHRGAAANSLALTLPMCKPTHPLLQYTANNAWCLEKDCPTAGPKNSLP